MKMKFWGVRGSIPTPGKHTVRYGGNTPCAELRLDNDELIILDAGTGIRNLGDHLINNGESVKGTVLITHPHWDHIQGFPFFVPAYIPGNEFFVYSLRGAGKPLEKVFRGQMDADYFPVPLSDMQARLNFIELTKPVEIGPIQIAIHHLNHPGVAVGFRISAGGKSVVYVSDHEPFYRMVAGEIGETEEARLVEFARGADLWIREAQYTEEEYASKKGWGHSTFDDAIRAAAAAGVGRLAIFHHDPMHDDDFMDHLMDRLGEQVRAAGHSFLCTAAREGEIIAL